MGSRNALCQIRRLVVAAATLTLVAATTPASATAEEGRFVSRANAERARYGLPYYAVAADLVSVARRHSVEMASRHTIYHNSRLGSDVSGWRAVGENVGMGGDVDSIHDAFMRSSSHRSNILDHDFTQIGVGTAHDNKGILYVTEVFRQPWTASAPAPAPRPQAPRRTTTLRVTAPAPPDPRVVLNRKLGAARRIAAREKPRTAVDHAFTYVQVVTALL